MSHVSSLFVFLNKISKKRKRSWSSFLRWELFISSFCRKRRREERFKRGRKPSKMNLLGERKSEHEYWKSVKNCASIKGQKTTPVPEAMSPTKIFDKENYWSRIYLDKKDESKCEYSLFFVVVFLSVFLKENRKRKERNNSFFSLTIFVLHNSWEKRKRLKIKYEVPKGHNQAQPVSDQVKKFKRKPVVEWALKIVYNVSDILALRDNLSVRQKKKKW